MESFLPLIIQLASGAAGGNVAGALLKNLSLGTLGNSIAGIAGGGIGGVILNMVASGAADGIIGQIAGGGVGGAIVMAIVGFIKNSMGK
ncbi:MAG: hypothetical protein GY948_06555 [Alphaproteobacteria bacterium]|nr:hypothetical protein [Alphaproteobacteria bacterium]